MDAYDALLAVSAITGLLAMLFFTLGMVSDYIWPWFTVRKPRSQATYRALQGSAMQGSAMQGSAMQCTARHGRAIKSNAVMAARP